MRKAVMSLPAADKSVWEIKMKGGRVPLRSAGCVVSVAVYRGKQCQLAGPARLAGAGVPRPPSRRILVTWGCLSLKLVFWGAGRKAAHLWELFPPEVVLGKFVQEQLGSAQPRFSSVSSGLGFVPGRTKGPSGAGFTVRTCRDVLLRKTPENPLLLNSFES